MREDQHDAGPHLRPGAVREAEHQEHDPLGQGNRRAARQAGQAESRTEPGDPRAGLGPAPAAHRTQGPRPGRRRTRPHTSLRCSACGWIDKNSRKSQAEFVCSFCGFTCNADTNAATNVAAGQGGIPRPRRSAGAGGMTTATSRSSIREPQPTWVGIPLS
ncbi:MULTISPECIES: zinc ribbon domain-containing protein [Streptomyces]|uniref:zinc ribbon domain-containing protein n=1 Tax=Streptomyces TaxID=1883 RepID=UPI0027E55125|nr:zinc ribbon domain-containing protein [Streptomyces sp. GbtcB7]